jgi:SpoVK/Ycf46/Vps4 family AAA+-type ATPase
MTEVKNYVCICASKRRVLREVALEIETFKNQQRTRSCLIEARPGSGKSLLAEMLAQDHGLFFLEFNITQMISKTDLLDCFDVISSTQFEKRGTKLLVFVDEIDADLGTGPVYDTFLAPLEQGIYRRASKTYHIDPCFWLFAGTADPSHSKKNKARDFVSRLTLKPRSMNTRKTEEFRLENVYLGTAILRLEFPDVREISTEVLKVFHGIKDTVSIRELRQFVKEFTDIKSGEVRRDNVPERWFGKLGIGKIGLPSKLEEMVEIKGEALSPNVFARFTPEGIKATGSKTDDQEE